MADIYRVSADGNDARRWESPLNTHPDGRFGTLYEAHAPQVARYAARRVAAEDVHDVIAETFLTAWLRLEEVPEDALPWLLGTARRHVANRHRAARRRTALSKKVATATSPRAWDDGYAEVDAALVAAIGRLPAAQREAFMLVAWDGLDAGRAAAAAGCSGPAFRVRLHRARTRLRKELSRLDPHHGPIPVNAHDMEEAR